MENHSVMIPMFRQFLDPGNDDKPDSPVHVVPVNRNSCLKGAHQDRKSLQNRVSFKNQSFIRHTNVLHPPDNMISSVCFVGNKKLIITASEQNYLLVWDVLRLKRILTFGKRENEIYLQVRVSDCAKYVAAVSMGNKILVFDFATRKLINIYNFRMKTISEFQFASNSKYLLASNNKESIVQLYRVGPQKEQRPCIFKFNEYDEQEATSKILVSPDGRLALSVQSDLTIWNFKRRKIIAKCPIRIENPAFPNLVKYAFFFEQGKNILITRRDSKLIYYSLAKKSIEYTSQVGDVLAIDISKGKENPVVACRTASKLHIRKVNDPYFDIKLQDYEDLRDQMAISPDSQLLVIGQGDNKIRIIRHFFRNNPDKMDEIC